jgi:hypothetical protein
MKPPKNSHPLFPSSEQLAVYSKLDPNLPSLLIAVIDSQLEREYKYPTRGRWIALTCFLSVLAAFCVLVAAGHSTVGGILLGTCILGLIAGFTRARLSADSTPRNLSEPLQEPVDQPEPD